MTEVLENLSEDEAYLFAILSDPSGLDQAEFLWVDHSSEDNKFCPICETARDGVHLQEHGDVEGGDWVEKYQSPSGCFRAWAYQWSWWRSPDALQIDQCFPAGTMILTKRGQVLIEQVQVGDLVLTHTGQWRPVTYTWDRGVQDLVTITGFGHWGLDVTADHKFLQADGPFRVPTPGDRWASPCQFPEDSVPPMPERSHAPGRPSNVPHDVTSPEWLWLYGRYLAEGSCSSSFGRGGTANRAIWSVHADERDQVEGMLKKVGLRWNAQPIRGEQSVNIIVNSRPVATWLAQHGGRGARNANLASWALGLNGELREAILDGAVWGDARTRPDDRIEYTTTSRRLAFGIKLLAQSLGHAVGINRNRTQATVIDGREIAGGLERFSVDWTLNNDRHPRATPIGGHLWSAVNRVDGASRNRCYDLEVADDHSFVADDIVVSNCARSVGKSLSVKVRGCAFPFLFPGQEMIITAPELVHLEPIVSLIESQMSATRTLFEMMPRGRSSVTHRPFQMNFLNGARIIGRIPQRDGKGVKGLHPIWLELDEAQDYPHAGWIELNETLKRGFTGAMWRAHGVTKGVRDDFYEITQDTPDNRWKVHRFAAMWRPNWTNREREEAIQKYGSREDPDYRRNVLGLHGDKTNPIFVLTQLMKNVDNEPLSEYNSGEYFKQVIKSEQLEMFEQEITDVLDFPAGHLTYDGDARQRRQASKAIYWVGMDIGFTIDPSEILVFVEHTPKPNAPTQLRLLTRISMVRMPHRQQLMAILHVIDYYRPKAFALDRGGVGLSLFQELQEHIEAFRDNRMDRIPGWMHQYDLQAALVTIKGYSFGEKLLVDIDKSVEISPFDDQDDIATKAGMKRNAKEYSTDVLRELVDSQRLWLPWDEDLLKQFQGGTWTNSRSMDPYGRRTFSQGNDHVLDASRMMALGWAQHSIEEMMRTPTQKPVYDVFMSF